MSNSISTEIESIAAEHGYDGPTGLSIAGAIDALADTLAGSDVDSGGGSIADAVRAIAPYIGSGGGGTQYGENYIGIRLAPSQAGSEGFVPDMSSAASQSFNVGLLTDPSDNKALFLPISTIDGVGTRFLDGTTVRIYGLPSTYQYPNESGPMDAVLAIPGSGGYEFTPYDGVTYYKDEGSIVAQIHDIPDFPVGLPVSPVLVIRFEIPTSNPPIVS